MSPDLDTAVTVDLGPAPTAWSRGGCGPSRLRPLFARFLAEVGRARLSARYAAPG